MDKDKHGKPLRVPIKYVDSLGNGRATHGGRKYHIPFVLPGEMIEPETVYHRGQDYYAYPEFLNKPHPARKNSDCVYFGRCGGCSYRHLSYDDSFALKLEQASKILRKVCGDVYIKQHPAELHRYYRTSARFYIHQGKVTQKTLLEHAPFVMDSCRIISREALALGKQLAAFLDVEMIEVLSNHNGGGHMVILHLGETSPVQLPKINIPHSVYLEQHGVYTHHQGPKELTYTLEVRGKGFEFPLPGGHFFQNNLPITEKLIETLIKYVPTNAQSLLELYGGVGTLSVPLAHFRPDLQIRSIEKSSEMTDALRKICTHNGISTLSAESGDLGAQVVEQSYDALLVDPPRKGLHKAVHGYIAAQLPQTILYVSCDVESFAKDVAQFPEGYQCTGLHYFDMMPYTRHGEVLGVFTKKEATHSGA